MAEAIKDVLKTRTLVDEAATIYGLPRRTLNDQINMNYPLKLGCQTVLKPGEELGLINYIKYMQPQELRKKRDSNFIMTFALTKVRCDGITTAKNFC